MIAGTERTELALEGTGRRGEFLGIDVHSDEHVMAGQPAPGDEPRDRISPGPIINRRDNIADPAVPKGASAFPDAGGGGRPSLAPLEAISVMSFLRMRSPKVYSSARGP